MTPLGSDWLLDEASEEVVARGDDNSLLDETTLLGLSEGSLYEEVTATNEVEEVNALLPLVDLTHAAPLLPLVDLTNAATYDRVLPMVQALASAASSASCSAASLGS